MSADKRSTHTDALETLGFILEPHQGERDAIHLAVEPVIAGHKLSPGEHVGIKDGKAVSHKYVRNRDVKLLGIVDPFIANDYVIEDDKFWLVVYPRQITSLRHVWVHPDFASEAAPLLVKQELVAMTPRQLAYKWIENYANSLSGPYYAYDGEHDAYADITAEDLISTACSHLGNGWGDYLIFGGKFEGESVDPEFWDHLATYLEQEIPDDKRRSFFSCAC